MKSKLPSILFVYQCFLPLLQILIHPLELATFVAYINYNCGSDKPNLLSLLMMLIPVFGVTSDIVIEANSYYYIDSIYREEGIYGIYTGIEPKIIEHILMAPICQIIWFHITGKKHKEGESNLGDELWYQGMRVLFTQPVYVIMVACFVDLTQYNNHSLLTIVSVIYTSKGFKGFYTGMVERLCGEMVFQVTRAVVSKLLCLNKMDAYSIPEIVLMMIRDCFARWLAVPFHTLSYKRTASNLN